MFIALYPAQIKMLALLDSFSWFESLQQNSNLQPRLKFMILYEIAPVPHSNPCTTLVNPSNPRTTLVNPSNPCTTLVTPSNP